MERGGLTDDDHDRTQHDRDPGDGRPPVTGQHILIGLLAAVGQAAVMAEDVPAHHGLVIAERHLHWSLVKFGEITARL